MKYFTEAATRIVEVAKGLNLHVFAAGFPEHSLATDVESSTPENFTLWVTDRASLGLETNQMSSEHGTLLNFLISRTEKVVSDFTIILDSDFFLCDGVELREVLRHMDACDLDLMGVPFPPDRIHQPWDFPAPFFQIWKSSFLYSRVADFRPRWAIHEDQKRHLGVTRSGLDQRISRSLRHFQHWLASQFRITGSSRSNPIDFFEDWTLWKLGPQTFNSDTGFRIYEDFASQATVEIMTLVINVPQGLPRLTGFHEEEYQRANPDVPSDAVQWHVRNVGLHAGRDMGQQSLTWRIVSLMVRHRWRPRLDQPDNHFAFDSALGSRLPRGDLYAWNHVPFGIHLGSNGKRAADEDISYVQDLHL